MLTRNAYFAVPFILLTAASAFAVGMGADAAARTAAILGAGSLLGIVWSHLVVRRAVRRLVAATREMSQADSSPDIAALGNAGIVGPIARALVDVEHALASAHEAATTDKLTQVANRPTILARMFAEVERAARYGRPLSVAFIDLDHFKLINDSFGHEVGDGVLRQIAEVFRTHTRQADVVSRYGGEEFVLLFPETTIDEATSVVEKLRLQVLKERFGRPGDEVAVTVSIGVAGGQGQHLRVDQLLRDADAAMYSAKSLGRNQTFVFAEIDDDSARIPRAPISPAGRARAAEVGEIGRQAAEAALAAIITPLPHYGGKPSSLIASIAVRIARELDQPAQEVERVRIASLLHDLGKVAIPSQILEKPGPLTSEEWQTIVQHPRLGQVIIEQVAAVRDAGAIILHHHEHFSGHGYPFGLRGTDIPLGSRIVAVADAYDAMVHDRPYRSAIGHEAALAELRRYSRVQFDPEIVDLFCKLYAAAPPHADDSLLISQPGHQAPARSSRRRASTA